MALNVYNAAKHHIGLKPRDDATNYGFMLHGAYTQEIQREGVGSPDFGGATDLIGQAPSLSRWTQDDFVGGMFQWNWGRDDAMFADCLGFTPDAQGRGLVSCPPMYQLHAFDPDVKANYLSDRPKTMFMVAGSIYIVFGHGILRYETGSGTETWKSALTNATYVNAEYSSEDQMIWALCNTSVSGDTPFIERIKTDLTSPTYDATFTGPTGTAGQTAMGFTIRDSNLLVNIGRKLYIGDPPDAVSPTANGTITWEKVGRVPGRWKDSQSYNGMTYILVNDGSFRSQIVAYDGDGILPICTFPSSFYALCMTEYAGRIFVGGTGTDINGGELYAELYEVTGASVRCVRSFGPETRTGLLNNGQWPNAIQDMAVHEGLLWFSQRGSRMIAYDVTTDGLFGAAENLDSTDLDFYKLFGGRGRLWAFGLSDANDSLHGIYRIAQPADAGSVTSADWNPTFTTSDFMYEPAMKKRWSQISVMHRYGTMASIEYSLDSGETWTALTIADSAQGEVHKTTASLAAIDPSEHIRFRCTFDSTDALTYHKELIAFSVSFAMLDTGKPAWSLVVNATREVETKDAEYDEGVTQEQDVFSIHDALRDWAADKTPLTLTDVDGDTYDVQIVGYRRSMPTVGYSQSQNDATFPEAFYSLTLLAV